MIKSDYDEQYFFDTNILLIWLYEKNTERAKRLKEILENLRYANRHILIYNLEELYGIIGDSYIIFYRESMGQEF
ncbi:hypothetical protein HS5_14030 [Acidianus sp. HS-5]|nr:hypothetical protein HS5_14030 [Acidianus sp. HS-5]